MNENSMAGTGEEECVYTQPNSSTQRPERRPSRWKIARTLLALIPRQFTDEMELAKKEIQHRGKTLVYALIFFAAAAIAALLLITASTIALIAVIAIALPLWLAALIVSAALIVVIVACVLFGVKTTKKALPITPELSLRGIVLDHGVLKNGDEFRAAVYDRKQENKRTSKERKKRAAKEEKKDSKHQHHGASHEDGNPAAISYSDLITRLNVRRDRMSYLRSQLKGKRGRQKPKFWDTARGAAPAEACQDSPQTWQQYETGDIRENAQYRTKKPLAEHLNTFVRQVKGRGSQTGKTKLPFMALLTSGLVSVLLLSPKKSKKARRRNKNSRKGS